MNKLEYMEALKYNLRRLPKEDFEKAIDYFEEYFQDAGVEKEAQVIEDLGSPNFAAEQIIATIAIENTQQPVKNVKKGLNALWVGLLALFAAPIALPLVLAVAIVLFAFVFSILLCIALFILAGILFVFCGIFTFISSFSVLVSNPPAFLICFGLSLASVGLGLLLTYGMVLLCKSFLTTMVRLFGRMVKKGGKKNEQK